MGSDFETPGNPYNLKLISIHAPVWGATYYDLKDNRVLVISIHAPVWGATILFLLALALLKISIHAPVWGAT